MAIRKRIKVGTTYGDWTVVGIRDSSDGFKTLKCKCKCGIVKQVGFKSLQNKRTRQCNGCARRETAIKISKDMVGCIYTKWTVIGVLDRLTHVKCKCECGHIREVAKADLKNGHSTKCKKCKV